MDKKDFLEEINQSVRKIRRKKFLIFLASFLLIIFFFFFLYSLLRDFSSNIYVSKATYLGIEKSFLYSKNKKAHDIRKDEATKLFSYSFIVKEEDVLDKKEWHLFLNTVPSDLKFKNKNDYQIYGFLNREELNNQTKELIKENIIKKFSIQDPKIDKELLK